MAIFECSNCTAPFPTSELIWCCEKCGGVLSVKDTLPMTRSEIQSDRHSLWRYQKALLHQEEIAVSLGEGWTPLVKGYWNDFSVGWKCEFISISGSFKDRGVSVMTNYLVANGCRKIAEDSSGNGGAAVATYAAAAGLECRIYVPAHTSPSKITQMVATGAEVIRITGSRQAVADAAAADVSGYFYASHNWHPAFLDGMKTIGYEIWEQLGFVLPDAIIAPAGAGSNLLGCFQAFKELNDAGEVRSFPRLYGAQSENCMPLARAFEIEARSYVDIDSRPTIAEGIAVTQPVRSRELLAAVRESGGGIFAVSEEAIAGAHFRLAQAGFYVEPTSATAAALLDQLILTGTVRSGENVVVLLTGSGLKTGDLTARMGTEGRA